MTYLVVVVVVVLRFHASVSGNPLGTPRVPFFRGLYEYRYTNLYKYEICLVGRWLKLLSYYSSFAFLRLPLLSEPSNTSPLPFFFLARSKARFISPSGKLLRSKYVGANSLSLDQTAAQSHLTCAINKQEQQHTIQPVLQTPFGYTDVSLTQIR